MTHLLRVSFGYLIDFAIVAAAAAAAAVIVMRSVRLLRVDIVVDAVLDVLPFELIAIVVEVWLRIELKLPGRHTYKYLENNYKKKGTFSVSLCDKSNRSCCCSASMAANNSARCFST